MNRIDRFILESSSWATFHAAASLLTNKKKGDLFERVAQLYLETTPEYRAALTDVWPLHKTPAHVLTEIGLPQHDVGIDLIARHRDGRYWAIQAKFRTDTDKALSWGDLSTAFGLASAPRRHISQFVVIHSTAKPISNRELMGSMVEIGLDHMRNADWAMIQAHILNGNDRNEPRTPTGDYAWQEIPVSAAVEHFRTHDRGRMLLPCGTGKSLIAYYIADRLNANNIVVAVPSLNLLRQSVHDTWLREEDARGRQTDWLCVASDDTVGQIDDSADEISDTGLPTTTNVNEIADWLRRPGDRKIVFTTYHSSAQLAEAAQMVNVTFDLIVLDEAHRTTGLPTRDFATLMHSNKIATRRRLFMTATERRINGKVDMFSMDENAAIYGPRFYTMSFKEAIERNIITDYKILVYAITDSEVRGLVDENRLLDLGLADADAVPARDFANDIIIKRVMRDYRVNHPLIFARSIEASKNIKNRQNALNGVATCAPIAQNFYVSSKMSAGTRAQTLAVWREAPIATMSNARCLTEGVDVPGVDAVIFTAPKQSTVDIVQAAGRAMRKFPSKEFGYIVIPVVIDDATDFDQFVDSDAYGKIIKIITALTTQDERIIEELKARFNGPGKPGKPRERVIQIGGEIPVGLNISIEEFADKIEIDVLRAASRRPAIPVMVYGVLYSSVNAACAVHGVNQSSVNDRVYKKGETAEQAIDYIKNRSTVTTVNGTEYLTFKAACRAHGVNSASAISRMRNHSESPEQAINYLNSREKIIVFGISYADITRACEANGVNHGSTRGRMRRYKETPEQAIAHLKGLRSPRRSRVDMKANCQKHGVNFGSARVRMQLHGESEEQAIAYLKANGRFNEVLVKGVSYKTVADACRANGVSYGSVKTRVNRRGETVEQAILTVQRPRPIVVVCNVEYKNIADACLANGVTYGAVKMRIKRCGETLEQAIAWLRSRSDFRHLARVPNVRC